MKRWFPWLFFLLLLTICSTATVHAGEKSLFDEPDKDAEASFTLQVEKDRKVESKYSKNLKAVEGPEEYLSRKIESLQSQIDSLKKRMKDLETLTQRSKEK